MTVDFRYAMFPGVITGRVFRDENANGTFEQGVDVPGPGIWVFLRADTGAVGAKLDSVRTDSLGAYQFGRVAPGNYFLEFEQLGAINYGAKRADATGRRRCRGHATLNVLYTGSIFVTIRQARATPVDSTVAVIGDITAPPGVFTSGTGGVNSEIWVQDTTGGIAAFPVPTADSATLRLGTRIEVVGPITLFSGQRQIGRAGERADDSRAHWRKPSSPPSQTRCSRRARSPMKAGSSRSCGPACRDRCHGGTGAAFTVKMVSDDRRYAPDPRARNGDRTDAEPVSSSGADTTSPVFSRSSTARLR